MFLITAFIPLPPFSPGAKLNFAVPPPPLLSLSLSPFPSFPLAASFRRKRRNRKAPFSPGRRRRRHPISLFFLFAVPLPPPPLSLWSLSSFLLSGAFLEFLRESRRYNRPEKKSRLFPFGFRLLFAAPFYLRRSRQVLER